MKYKLIIITENFDWHSPVNLSEEEVRLIIKAYREAEESDSEEGVYSAGEKSLISSGFLKDPHLPDVYPYWSWSPLDEAFHLIKKEDYGDIEEGDGEGEGWEEYAIED